MKANIVVDESSFLTFILRVNGLICPLTLQLFVTSGKTPTKLQEVLEVQFRLGQYSQSSPFLTVSAFGSSPPPLSY